MNKDNAYVGTPGGNGTFDYLFCLSVDEVQKNYEFNSCHEDYFTGCSEALSTEATEYAKDSGVNTFKIDKNSYLYESR